MSASRPVTAAHETCVSCGAVLTGHFCAACGERKVDAHDLSLRHFLGEALHDVLHFDTKVFRTLGHLVGEPGGLTADWLRGVRKRYLSPVQLFLVVNLVFFFVTPRINIVPMRFQDMAQNQRILWTVPTQRLVEQARGGRSREELAREFDREVEHRKRVFVIVMVALFTGVLALAMAGRGRGFVEHAVFSLHYYAFWMLLMVALPLALFGIGLAARAAVHAMSGGGQRVVIGDTLLIPVSMALSAIYLFVAIRRVYKAGKAASAALAISLSAAMLGIFLVYRELLTFVTLKLL